MFIGFIGLALIVLAALNFSRSIAAPAFDGRPEQQTIKMIPSDVLAFKDTQFLNFTSNRKTKYALDELKCDRKEVDEELNEEDKLCPKYAVQAVNCANADFERFYHPKWECDYIGLSPKLQIDWQLVRCDTIDKSPHRYGVGTCYLRYGLKSDGDEENNKNPAENPDGKEKDKLNPQTGDSSLLWLYIAGGCLAALFFLVGILICYQTVINEQTCCECDKLESFLCMESCCEISSCCLQCFGNSH